MYKKYEFVLSTHTGIQAWKDSIVQEYVFYKQNCAKIFFF